MTSNRKQRLKSNIEMINKITSLVLASSRLKDITLPSGKTIRGNIHLIIYGDIGQGKSTLLKFLADSLKIKFITGFTKATLLGSVDEHQNFIPPLVWTYRNSILMLDDFDVADKHKHENAEISSAFLSLLENPSYKRPIAYRSFYDKKDKGLYCIVKDTQINVLTRFSFICTTMFDPYSAKGQQRIAFVSRCLVIYLNFDMDDLDFISTVNDYYEIINYEVPKEPKIDSENYEIIRKQVRKFSDNTIWYLRTINDLARIFIILKEHDYKLYDYICKSRKNIYKRQIRYKEDSND